MTQNRSVLEAGIDQIQSTVRVLDRRFRRLQRQLTTRRRQLERQVTSRRRALERRAQRQISRLRRRRLVKRAETLREDVTRQVEQGLSGLLETLPIATKRDVQRIDRRVSQLNRKLRDLEQASA